MCVREPAFAWRFYAGDPDDCRRAVSELLGDEPAGVQGGLKLFGGIVPHAGWMCSGAVAGKVFRALGASRSPKTIVLFGGVHRRLSPQAAMFSEGRWETPIASIQVDSELAGRILDQTDLIVDDPGAHADEHSIEVQLPFVAHVFPDARIVPIMVPPMTDAHLLGEAVGRVLADHKYDAYVVGTTDLTHYGPNYRFTPRGVGPEGNKWAKEVNDKPFIELMCGLRAAEVVREAGEKRNACSSGAVAATIGAVVTLGATKGILLEHTTSSDVLGRESPGEYEDSVGYAGVLFA